MIPILWLSSASCFGITPVRHGRDTYRLGKIPGARLLFKREHPMYVARGGGFKLTISATEAVLTSFEGFGDVDEWFREEQAKVQLLGALPSQMEASEPGWLDQVRFHDVYPDVDLVCSGTPRRLEYIFIIGAEGNAGAIRMELKGLGQIRINDDGSVTMRTPMGVLLIHPPVTYDRFDGERRRSNGHFELLGKSRLAYVIPVN